MYQNGGAQTSPCHPLPVAKVSGGFYRTCRNLERWIVCIFKGGKHPRMFLRALWLVSTSDRICEVFFLFFFFCSCLELGGLEGYIFLCREDFYELSLEHERLFHWRLWIIWSARRDGCKKSIFTKLIGIKLEEDRFPLRPGISFWCAIIWQLLKQFHSAGTSLKPDLEGERKESRLLTPQFQLHNARSY